MAQNVKRAEQYVKQARERLTELSALLVTAQGGNPDWSAVLATARSLEANLESAAADLFEPKKD